MRISNVLSSAGLVVAAMFLSTASGCASDPDEPGGGAGSGGALLGASGGATSSTGGAMNAASGGTSTNPSGGTSNSSSGGASNPGTGGAESDGSGGDPSGDGDGDGDGEMRSAGCGQTAPMAGRASIDVGGMMREYILYLPEGYDPEKAYRLVFTWHPWGGSAQQVAGNGPSGYYGLRGASNGEAILVSPEGLEFGGSGLGWGNTNGQDIDFLEAMMERFDAELCFDKNRVFSTGFSFGGMMSNAVACSGLARAVAPMAGNSSVSGCPDGGEPVAYMGFHGDHDSVVDISGGRAARDVFIERNGCGAEQPSDSNWCDQAGANFQPCECVTYADCTDGYPVTWCEYNGDHMVAPNSGQTIWDFFAQF